MARTLKFNLRSQSQIPKEGNLEEQALAISVGKHKIDFYIPDIEAEIEGELIKEDTPKVQKVVDKINQYIENIADDYFLLGLHLIALHKMLKKSGLSTEQVRTWYAENINMPYSSAMQCKKVAEVYSPNPDLINRYTASGAYLLSSCKTQEEREEIWDEARGKKPSASVRNIREVLKKRREQAVVESASEDESDDYEIEEEENLPPTYRMTEIQIHEALLRLASYAEDLTQCTDPTEQIEMRHALIQATHELVEKMEELL